MAPVLDRKIAKDDVRGILERDRLVGARGGSRSRSRRNLAGVIPREDIGDNAAGVEKASVDQPWPRDHDVRDADAVDEAVGPVAVALVLESDEEVHLRRVI